MTDTKQLLTIRKSLKKKTPEFLRQQVNKLARIKHNWNRPKGLHSKMREHNKGHPRMPNIGWRGPAAIRGLHQSGLQRVHISTSSELAKLDKAIHGIIISGTLGTKKRLALISEIKKRSFTILNLRDPEGYVQLQEARLKQRKELHTARAKEKEQKKKAAEKKTEKKPKEGIEQLTEEEKKKQEKEEKDKVLTQKQ